MSSDKSDTKDLIVAAARNIFNKYGFKKATLDEIAHSIGKGKSSIYYYFNSKEEIYQAVVEFEAAFLRHEVVKSIAQTDNPTEKLKNYVLTRMRTLQKVSNFYDAVRSEVLSHLEIIDQIRDKYDREEVRLLQDILEEGVAKKVFRVEHPEITALAIVTALKGIEIPMFWSNKRKHAEVHLEQLLHVLFYGIMKQ